MVLFIEYKEGIILGGRDKLRIKINVYKRRSNECNIRSIEHINRTGVGVCDIVGRVVDISVFGQLNNNIRRELVASDEIRDRWWFIEVLTMGRVIVLASSKYNESIGFE